MYSLIEGPFIFYAKPNYEYKSKYSMYVGSTRMINHWIGCFVTLFGFLIALSRMRDKIVRVKMWNLWYRMTCRRSKMVKFDEFEKIVEQS